MARTINQIKGDELEDAVRLIEMVILGAEPNAMDSPITIECKKILTFEGVKHEIDIYITINNGKGYTSTFIFECKNWQAKVDKNEIIAFAQKVKDVKAQKGYFVAKSFTGGAIAQAKRDGIELLTAQDAIDTLPSFLDDYHILGTSIVLPETTSKFLVNTYEQHIEGPLPKLKNGSLVKYKGKDMLLGHVIEMLQMEVVHEHMEHQATATFGEEIHRHEADKTINFSNGELVIEGIEPLGIQQHVVWESQIVRPAITSQFDIKTRGRVITLTTDKAPFEDGTVIQISFIAVD